MIYNNTTAIINTIQLCTIPYCTLPSSNILSIDKLRKVLKVVKVCLKI